ncbi:MAG: sensor histidine kinase [Oscillospiraceae bacterium]|nr:sensor histidine kinase [Oscillospiraceae bacterium]
METIINRRKTLSVGPLLLAAVLTVLALMLLVRLPEQLGSRPKSIVVTERAGVYNLTRMTDTAHTVAVLPPGNSYYPDILLTPETVDSAAPVSKSEYQAKRSDYLSQRFILLLPDNSEVYTLSFRLSGRHAMRVYVNGTLAAQSGVPGTSKQNTVVWENNISCRAVALNGKIDVILDTSQFYHAKGGASLATLNVSFPDYQGLFGLSLREKGLLVMGALLCAAVLLLSVYLFMTRTPETLFFALACLSMALRECLQSQAWTYFRIPGNLSFMLEYLSMVLLTIFLSLYLRPYVRGRFLHIVWLIAIVSSILYGFCIVLWDSLVYTALLKYYQILLVGSIVPGIAVLMWQMRRPNREQAAVLFGIVVFYLAAVGDIIMYSDIFGDSRVNAPVSEAAMLIFAVVQTVSLLMMSTRVLNEAKEAERRLAAENAALERLDRMKTEFLGNVTHELKTPLTVISGYAQQARRELLPDCERDGELSSHMRLICEETERMALMIGQVLDLTRIDEGRMPISLQKVSIVEVIQQTAETYFGMLNKNSNRLRLSLPDGLPMVSADPDRVRQVILNLLSNAMRFTRGGHIDLSAEEKDGYMEVSVSDTGDGIAEEDLPALFTRNGTGKKMTRTGTNTGTGLGLFICRHIIEAHGGVISAESSPGIGTCVRFTLPIHTEFSETCSPSLP